MTIENIAQLANTSISTISEIVSNRNEDINPETKNRILKIVKDYNCVPYDPVEDTPKAKTFVLGVLLRYISETNLFLNEVTSAVQAEGYSVMVYDSNGDMEHGLKNITSLCKNHIDGVIQEPTCEQGLEYRRYFDEQNIGICLMNAAEKQPCYFINFEEVGYQATRVLLDYHHRKLGCLIKENGRRSQVVLEGFHRRLFDNNISLSEDMGLPTEGSE